MNSLELAAIDPYQNGELVRHTAGIIRDAEIDEILRQEDDEDRKLLKRELEFRLVQKFDKTKINARRECWFIIDIKWLNDWGNYIEGLEGATPPGKLSTADLFDENKKLLPGLKAKIDYRGVPPLVYYIFKELYGEDNSSPVICRYVVDIYQLSVKDEHIVQIVKLPQLQAREYVTKMKSKYEKWGDVTHDDEDDEDEYICCGLTKDHFESILYWIFSCCSRGKSGRKDISYRAYKPLQRTVGEGDDMSEWSVRSTSTLGSIDSQHSALSDRSEHADFNFGQSQIGRNWMRSVVGGRFF